MRTGAPSERKEICPICGGQAFDRYGERDQDHLVSCRACGLVFSLEGVPEGFCEQTYSGLPCERYLRREKILRREWGKILAEVEMAGLPGRQVLDVGFGAGIFMKLAAERGFEAVGIDIDAGRVERCRARGLNVLHGRLPDPRLEPESFDLVWASHIIEHLDDPGSFLCSIVEVLKPGGMAAITTPNIKGAGLRVCGCHHPLVAPPVHVAFFSPRSMRELARAHGLIPERVYAYGAETALKDIAAYLLKLKFLRKPSAPPAAAGSPASGGNGETRLVSRLVMGLSRLAGPALSLFGGHELVGLLRKPADNGPGDPETAANG